MFVAEFSTCVLWPLTIGLMVILLVIMYGSIRGELMLF